MKRPRVILDAFVGGLVSALFLTPPLWLLDWALGINDAEVLLLLGVLCGAGLTGWGSWRRKVELDRRRMGLCAGCGYDIRASVERCPECGTRIMGGSPQATRGGEMPMPLNPAAEASHTEEQGSSGPRS